MAALFGTDGVRGLANVPPMTPADVMRLGQAFARWLTRHALDGPVLIGRDSRLSGPMLEGALVAGLASESRPVWVGGVLPTPAVSLLVRELGAAAGAILSASHNPYEDNGVKFVRADGSKLSPGDESEIEGLVAELTSDAEPRTGEAIGSVTLLSGLERRYVRSVVRILPGDRPLGGMWIVCDCANGAASRTTPAALRALGARVTALRTRPDGRNINAGCGSLHPEVMQRAVRARPGSVGLAHDGDADRVVFSDEAGNLIDGDRLLALLAVDLDRRGELDAHTLVATIMSNAGLDEAMTRRGIRVVRAQVGDRNVAAEMVRTGAALGGEASGHVILSRHAPTGDGLLTALAVFRAMRDQNAPLGQLASIVRLYPQHAGAVRIERKPALDELPDVAAAIRKAESEVAPHGRVVVRYSGTEPLARVLVEGPEATLVRTLGLAIEASLRAAIGKENL